MTDLTRSYFESAAPTWDARMPDHLTDVLRQFTAHLRDNYAADFANARALLEIGTGTGAFIPFLADLTPSASRIHVDLAHAMLAQARVQTKSSPLIQADVHNLPFSNIFDTIICHNSFPHFADQPRALREIARVLQSGGSLFILHHLSRNRVNTIHSTIGGAVARHHVPSVDEMRHLLTDAGFTAVYIDDAPTHYIAHAKKP